MQERNDSARGIAFALVGVMAVMLWPIWLAIAAAERTWTWTVAATALIPLAVSLAVLAAAFRVPERIFNRYERGLHQLSERMHVGTHRHA